MTEPSQYFKGRTVQEQMDEVIGYVDVRSAEVATTAIASDVAQVHQDMLDADADASAAAASAAAAAGTLANAVKKTGEASQSIAGDIAVSGDLTGGTVTVPAPVNNTDAASKKYVDDQDALKLNITDVNSYAVGLTGAQDVFGMKTHQFRPYVKPNTSKALLSSPAENQYVKLYDIAVGGTPRVVHGIIKSMWFIQNRFEIEFWVGGFNSSSTFSMTKSIGSNDNLRVTRDANNVWSIWFRYVANSSTNNRAFSEIIDQFYSYGYSTDLITVITPDNQVLLNESSAEWSNYTIIANQELS